MIISKHFFRHVQLANEREVFEQHLTAVGKEINTQEK